MFYSDGDETLEQVSQWGCGCPIPGHIQGWTGSEQPDLVEDIPAFIAGGLD